MPPIVIATNNPHKVAELRAILAGHGFEVLGLDDLPGPFHEPIEHGTTFEENAAIKAISYAQQTGHLCLADDSGLEVDALGGAPGVISSHYSTDGAETGLARPERDRANNERLLRELAGVPPERRTGRFVCVMALAHPGIGGDGGTGAAGGTGFQPVDQSTTGGTGFQPVDQSTTGGTGFQPVDQRTAGGTGFQPVDQRTTRGTGFQPVDRASSTGSEPVDLPPNLARNLRPCDMTRVNLAPGGLLRITHGDLPHWHQDGRTYFITFRVHVGELSPAERDIVLAACLHWHGKRALVHLVVVMPDHVHLLITPLPKPGAGWHTLPELMHSIKSFTANEINRAHATRGTVWQQEYFDRLVRDADEFDEKWRYMLNNPVKAGLVERWDRYRWTSGGSMIGQNALHRLEAGATGPVALHRLEAGATSPLDLHRLEAGATSPLVGQSTLHRLEAGATNPLAPHRLEAGPTILVVTRGAFEGRIGLPGDVPRGPNGFGYDPVFLVAPDFTRTSAELSPEEKNARSHRGMAARLMAVRIRELSPLH